MRGISGANYEDHLHFKSTSWQCILDRINKSSVGGIFTLFCAL